jgi:conjugal transfer pilus assembly protein TraB
MSIEENKKKQRLMLFASALLVLTGVMFIVFKLHGGVKPIKKKGGNVVISEVNNEAEKAWYVEAKQQLSEMQKQMADIGRAIEEISQKLNKHEKEIERIQNEIKNIKKVPTPPVPTASAGKKAKKEEKGGFFARFRRREQKVPPPPPPPPAAGRRTAGGKGRKAPTGIEKISFASELKKREKAAESEKLETLRKFYIPSGTFVSGILLSGVDAPTGVGAKKDTIPVLITLADNSILPNDWKYDLKDCRIIGEAYGDLSSERVYIRTDYMSCVDDDGNVYDFELDGYVAGEDGKVGLRGRVVSKQGALIARALLAGFFEGAGNVMQMSASTMTITGSGVVSTVNPSQVTRAGVYAGFASAAKKLSDYFMNLLDQTFPVIEIGAGRKVTVVVQKGRWIRRIGKTEETEQVKVKTAKASGGEK